MDERSWRHPSEIAALEQIESTPRALGMRLWGMVAVSGAAIVIGLLWMLGGSLGLASIDTTRSGETRRSVSGDDAASASTPAATLVESQAVRPSSADVVTAPSITPLGGNASHSRVLAVASRHGAFVVVPLDRLTLASRVQVQLPTGQLLDAAVAVADEALQWRCFWSPASCRLSTSVNRSTMASASLLAGRE